MATPTISTLLSEIHALKKEIAWITRHLSGTRPDDRLVGTAEAARLLGVGRSTLTQMARDGKISCIRESDGKTASYRFSYNYIQSYISDRFPPLKTRLS